MSTEMNFTEKSEQILRAAFDTAAEAGTSEVHPLHLAYSLWEDPSTDASATSSTADPQPTLFKTCFEKAGGDVTSMNRAILKAMNKLPSVHPAPSPPLPLTNTLNAILRSASSIQKEQHDSYIAVDHILLALLRSDSQEMRMCWADAKVDDRFRKRLEEEVKRKRGGRRVDSKNAEAGFEALSKYAVDLTELASQGKIDPVIGRDNEIRRVIRILCRRTKSNPVLIGEPGVGKSAIVEGLAQRIIARDVPASLLCKLFSLDMGALMAGASHVGEYEERLKSVLKEIEKKADEGEPIILFVDEMHLLMSGKQSVMDAGNLLKPSLARGKIRCIGATTLAEYREYIEKDAALERRFAQVIVEEPTVPDTISILRGIKEKYETHHGCRIADAALVSAAQLAKQYIPARRLPDSAIDLLDEAATSVRVQRETRPEAIDILERRKLALEVEIHALEREKDDASKERLEAAQKQLQAIDEELGPLLREYENEKDVSDQIAALRRKIDELKNKADEAERKYDLATASDIRYYSIPDRQRKLAELELRESEQQGKKGGEVGPEQIAEVVARWTGIPVSSLVQTEKEKLLHMEKTLAQSVIGQPEAVKSVANAIRLSRSGLGNNKRPIASFLLVGPSGTGKTLLAKTVAKFMFNSEDAIVRLDASEYSQPFQVSRLIGSAPGYVGYEQGGELTEKIRRKPYSLILIDEIEKAHRDFVMLFLQVLDDGVLTDNKGRRVDFRNTIIMMTSNLGATYLTENDHEGPVPAAVKSKVNESVRSHFPPEFINRIDDIIFYRSLTRKDIRRVVSLRLREVQDRLDDNNRKIRLEVDEPAQDWLASAGYSPQYGARPLARVIQQEILNPLARLLLQNRIRDGESARVTSDAQHNRLVILPNHDADVEMADDDDGEMDDVDDDMVVEEMD